MPSIGWQEILIVLFVFLVIFGPRRLPEIGRSVGNGIKEFRNSTSGIKDQITQDQTSPGPTEEKDSAAAS